MKQYETSFLEVMGNSPRNRILDFLIENRRTSWQYKEIIKSQEIGYSTLKKIIPELYNLGLVIVEEVIGRNKLIRINHRSKIVINLIHLHNVIADERVNAILQNQVQEKKDA